MKQFLKHKYFKLINRALALKILNLRGNIIKLYLLFIVFMCLLPDVRLYKDINADINICRQQIQQSKLGKTKTVKGSFFQRLLSRPEGKVIKKHSIFCSKPKRK